MPREKKSGSDFRIKELNLKEAEREFNRRRGRASKYDQVLEAAEKLGKDKAILIEQASYSEVTGIRQRVKEYLGEGWSIDATKADKEKGLYDVLIRRDK